MTTSIFSQVFSSVNVLVDSFAQFTSNHLSFWHDRIQQVRFSGDRIIFAGGDIRFVLSSLLGSYATGHRRLPFLGSCLLSIENQPSLLPKYSAVSTRKSGFSDDANPSSLMPSTFSSGRSRPESHILCSMVFVAVGMWGAIFLAQPYRASHQVQLSRA
jgi:hypothetical protein